MKKVLLICPLISGSYGGIQSWMLRIASLLEYYGVKVTIVELRRPSTYWRIFLNKTDFLVLATWKMGFLFYPLTFISKRVITFLHGNELIDRSICRRLVISGLGKTGKNTFVANSKSISSLFSSILPRLQADVIYPICNAEHKINDDLLSKTFQTNRRKILFLGRLDSRKNCINLLRAVLHLNSLGIFCTLTIAGDGEDREKIIREIQSNDASKSIIYVGKVDNLMKHNLMLEHNFFAMPSIACLTKGSIEGFGIVYHEAQLYGLPCLAGFGGGVSEAVADGFNGVFTDGTVNDIACKLNRLFKIEFNRKEIMMDALNRQEIANKNILRLFEISHLNQAIS